jgi:hypothetical protein
MALYQWAKPTTACSPGPTKGPASPGHLSHDQKRGSHPLGVPAAARPIPAGQQRVTVGNETGTKLCRRGANLGGGRRGLVGKRLSTAAFSSRGELATVAWTSGRWHRRCGQQASGSQGRACGSRGGVGGGRRGLSARRFSWRMEMAVRCLDTRHVLRGPREAHKVAAPVAHRWWLAHLEYQRSSCNSAGMAE